MSHHELKSQPSPSNLETVLVAEPDVLARLAFAEYLRECGYEVLEAGSAEDVLALLRSGREIEVLLLNSQISEGKGFSLARKIRESHPRIDIVLTFGIAKSAEKAGEICDNGPKERPYHPREIVGRIQKMRRARNETSD